MNEAIALTIVFLFIWGGHWMPWWICPAIVDEERQLLRPLAYVFGCLGIFLGLVVWALMLIGDGVVQVGILAPIWFLAMDIVAAGAGAMLPRAIKLATRYRALEGDNDDYEQAIQER